SSLPASNRTPRAATTAAPSPSATATATSATTAAIRWDAVDALTYDPRRAVGYFLRYCIPIYQPISDRAAKRIQYALVAKRRHSLAWDASPRTLNIDRSAVAKRRHALAWDASPRSVIIERSAVAKRR